MHQILFPGIPAPVRPSLGWRLTLGFLMPNEISKFAPFSVYFANRRVQFRTWRIRINLRNNLWQKWGGYVHPSPTRGDAPHPRLIGVGPLSPPPQPTSVMSWKATKNQGSLLCIAERMRQTYLSVLTEFYSWCATLFTFLCLTHWFPTWGQIAQIG